MILGDLIKEYRTNNNLSLRDFAQKCGLSHSYISALEKNIDPRTGKPIAPTLDTIKYISKGMNLSIEEILKILDDEQEFKMNEEAPTSNTTQAVVLVYGTIPAGIPIECIEDIIDTEEISADMLRGNKQYFGLKIKGNSMYPDYHDGDTIILEKVEDCESGQDCVVMVNGYEGTFKKVVKDEQNQTIRLQPINTSLGIDGKPLFEAITYTKEQINRLPVRIMGKVVELRRKI